MVSEKAVPNLGLTLGGSTPAPAPFIEVDPLSNQLFKRQNVRRIRTSLLFAPKRVPTLFFLFGWVNPLLDLLLPFCGLFKSLSEGHIGILAESKGSVDGAFPENKVLCEFAALQQRYPDVQPRHHAARGVLGNGPELFLSNWSNVFHVQTPRNHLKIDDFQIFMVERNPTVFRVFFVSTIDLYPYFYQKARAVDNKGRDGIRRDRRNKSPRAQ